MLRWIYIAALAGLVVGCDAPSAHHRGDPQATGTYAEPAVDLRDIAWKYRASAPFMSPPLVAHDLVYVADARGALAALELEQGSPVWEVELDHGVHAPLTAMPARVLVGTDGGIRALSPEGELEWSFDTDLPVDAAPLVWDQVAYFGTRGGEVYAVDAVGGALIWTAKAAGPIVSETVQIGSHLAVGSQDGRVYLLDPATGGPKWTWSAGAPVRGVAAGTGVLFVTAGTQVFAVEEAKPEVRWQFDVGGRVETPPTVSKGLVVVGNDKSQVVALSAEDGSQAWRVELGAPTRGTITASGGRFYVPASRDGVVALSEKGERDWTFRTDGPVFAGPLPAGGLLYFADANGSVYAIE